MPDQTVGLLSFFGMALYDERSFLRCSIVSSWNSMEVAPEDRRVILAYGYPLQPYSNLREDSIVALIVRSGDGWVMGTDWQPFEPIEWLSVPDMPEVDDYEQRFPDAPPKYWAGQKVKFRSRYDGVIEVTITSVIRWPSGWWYGLSEIDNPGHGNPSIGHGDLLWHDDKVFGRPARETELFLEEGEGDPN
jgi:hypothetical protein